MNPRIITISAKKIIGKSILTCHAENKNFELWSSFMPRKKEIENAVSTELFSIEIFGEIKNFKDFTPNTFFEKWAGIEVYNFENVPDGFLTIIIPEGLYAVFTYKGNGGNIAGFFKNIYTNWMQYSEYELDNRPHFEVMGDKYIRDSDESEEDVFIPIKIK